MHRRPGCWEINVKNFKVAVALLSFLAGSAFLVSAASPPKLLAWDAVHKEIVCKPGAKSAQFAFSVTNVSPKDVIILRTPTTCGCTVAKLPEEPWVLPPGGSGQIKVTVDLTDKMGTVKKGVFVIISNAPTEMLSVQAAMCVIIPPPTGMSTQDRARNIQLAKANARAIFQGSCADCHVVPSQGRMGGDLYITMCAICHDAGERQASAVPNLRHLKKPVDFNFWKNTIANGVTNSLMPGFAKANGGPLTEAEIQSLAEYLNKTIPPSASVESARQ